MGPDPRTFQRSEGLNDMTDNSALVAKLNDLDVVIADPFRFKARLEIGEEAFQMLSLRNKAFELWDVAGASVTGAGIAGSSAVASTFFSATTGGIFGFFGVATAATPLGWIIAAAVASGGAYCGVLKLMRGMTDDRVEIVPKFINTPLDVLAVSLFDLIAPLGLKVAAADGDIAEEELDVIRSYFIDGWGFNPDYVEVALQVFVLKIHELPLKDLTEDLRKFTLENRDCNHKKVREKIVQLLREIAGADGQVHEVEELMIDHVSKFLPKDPWFQLPKLGEFPRLPKLPSLRKG